MKRVARRAGALPSPVRTSSARKTIERQRAALDLILIGETDADAVLALRGGDGCHQWQVG